jgi:hypothetical protein
MSPVTWVQDFSQFLPDVLLQVNVLKFARKDDKDWIQKEQIIRLLPFPLAQRGPAYWSTLLVRPLPHCSILLAVRLGDDRHLGRAGFC